MKDLQNYVDRFGFGISVKELCRESYRAMARLGHEVCILNDQYLTVDGTTYSFCKSCKQGRWIIKEF